MNSLTFTLTSLPTTLYSRIYNNETDNQTRILVQKIQGATCSVEDNSRFCCKLRQFHPRTAAKPIFRVSRMKFSGRQFPKDVILQAVRWYVSYPLSFRMIEEMFAERGMVFDHSTINRWVVAYAAKLDDTTNPLPASQSICKG